MRDIQERLAVLVPEARPNRDFHVYISDPETGEEKVRFDDWPGHLHGPAPSDAAIAAVDLLPRRKAYARAQVISYADQCGDVLVRDYPPTERLGFPAKEASARAYQAGTASSADLALLQAEADFTGELLDVLVVKILVNADLLRTAVGQISGLRRATIAALDAATTEDQIAAVIANAKAAADQALLQLTQAP